KALYVAQMQVTQTKTPVLLVMREADQPVGNFNVLVAQFRLVAIASFADAEDPASQTDANPIFSNSFLRHLSTTRRLYHFFSMASLRMSAFSRASAYIFFRRRFSSSSSFRRAIMEASMPPNFARHL